MNYTIKNNIKASLNTVANKIADPKAAKEWTEGLESVEQIESEYCKVGSKRKLTYKFGKKEMIMTETILENDLPKSIKFAYDSSMGRNIVELVFEELSSNETQQTCHTEIQINGWMKYVSFLFGGMFKKQTQKYMEAFKSYAEK